MGYAMVMADCLICKKLFSMNPVKVPSFRVDGVKRPICQPCLEYVNDKRELAGSPPFVIANDAYQACDERELV
jgi:hypothetical protein